MSLRQVKYVGKDKTLKGKTAVALPSANPGKIKIQMDDARHPHGSGWHYYKSVDWADDEDFCTDKKS